MYSILVVDDEEKIRTVIRKYGEFEGYKITEVGNGIEAINICEKQDFDLIILDIMMPELDGFTTCKKIREKKDIPIIMLSARGEEYDKIHGFEIGIDDYVVKPFSPRELMLRAKVVIGRHNKKPEINEKNDVFDLEGLHVDFTGRIVTIDGKQVDMTPKEYDLLFYLVSNRGVALTREKLINDVWGYDYYGDDRTLDTHIKLLRSALGKYRKYLVTLRGVGYRFEKGGQAIGIATDLGEYTDYTIDKLSGLDVLLLEANHDIHMLQVGGYPYHLKQRILGKRGHLSNEASGQLLSRILHDGLKAVLLGHLSKENNYEQLAYETVRLEIAMADNKYKPDDFPIYVAGREKNSLLVTA